MPAQRQPVRHKTNPQTNKNQRTETHHTKPQITVTDYPARNETQTHSNTALIAQKYHITSLAASNTQNTSE